MLFFLARLGKQWLLGAVWTTGNACWRLWWVIEKY